MSFDQPNEKTPMSQQWDLSVQRQLPGRWVVEASYSGNHGTHLVAGGYNLNQSDSAAILSLGTTLQNTVPNPYAGIVPGSLGGGHDHPAAVALRIPYNTGVTVRNPHSAIPSYHAGLLAVQKHFSQGLTLLASYTKWQTHQR